MSKPIMTFEQFQDEMVEVAKRIQGDRYPGDEYYRQECWREQYYSSGYEPETAVCEDMTYWD